MANVGFEFAATFSNNKTVKAAILVSFLFFAASCLFTLFTFSQLPAEIPLFYSTNNKILTGRFWIFLLPTAIFLINLANLLMSKFLLVRQAFLAQVLLVATAIVSFLIVWAQIRITLLF